MESMITVVGKTRMIVGMNYAWAYNRYGWYFGPKHDEPWIADFFYYNQGGSSAPKTQSAFGATLDKMKGLVGVKLIRLFLLCNAQNLGATNTSGLWSISKPLPPEFENHLRVILETLRAKGMKAILSILDFGIGAPNEASANARSEGRHRIVTDPYVRADFMERVVAPLVRVGTGFHDAIYAWEAMNEPSWLSSRFWPEVTKTFVPAATVEQVNVYLNDVLATVRSVDPAVKTTVGHRYFDDLARFATGDLPQFHYYPRALPDPLLLLPHTIPGTDPVALPIATGRSQKPILGEIAAAPSGHDFPWHELRGRDAGDARSRVRERLFAAEQKGYEVVLLWPDLGNDGLIRHDSLKYSDEALDGIRDFSAGRRGPK